MGLDDEKDAVMPPAVCRCEAGVAAASETAAEGVFEDVADCLAGDCCAGVGPITTDGGSGGATSVVV